MVDEEGRVEVRLVMALTLQMLHTVPVPLNIQAEEEEELVKPSA